MGDTLKEYASRLENLANQPGFSSLLSELILSSSRGFAKVVAAVDSSHELKQAADFLCDGIDDHVQIQEAIEAANGSAVLLGAGSFSIKQTPVVNKPSTLFAGMGAATIIKRDDEVYSLLTSTAASGQAKLTVSDSSGFEVGMTIWISDDAPNHERKIIKSIAGNIITCTVNLTHTYTTADNAVVNSYLDCLKVTADNVIVRDLKADGNYANNSHGYSYDDYGDNCIFVEEADHVTIENVWAYDARNNGINLYDSDYCLVRDCFAWFPLPFGPFRNNAGIETCASVSCKHVKFVNNFVWNVPGDGLDFDNAIDSEMIGNTVYNVDGSSIELGGSGNMCALNHLDTWGIRAVHDGSMTGGQIINNQIYNGMYGITQNGNHNLIEGNTFRSVSVPIVGTGQNLIFNNIGYVHISEIRETISNILDIFGDARALWPFAETIDALIYDYSRRAHTLNSSAALPSFDTIPDYLGRTTFYTFNGTDEELDVADHADFEFGNAAGNDDSAFSVLCIISPHADAVASGGTIIGKYNENTPAREWIFRIDSNGYPQFELYDESATEYIGREDQTALTAATWTILIATYSGNEACNGITIYKDGVAVDDADHKSAGAYVGMEQLSAKVSLIYNVVSGPANGNFFKGSATWFGITGKELSADEAWLITQRLKGLMGI